MDEQLQYRFKQLEIEPPGGNWEAIQAKLDEEIQVEISLSKKLQAFEVEPPSLVWEQIASTLNTSNPVTVEEAVAPINHSEPARVVPFQWRKIAAAAAVLIFVGLTLFFLFFNNNTNNKGTTLTTVPGQTFVPPSIIPEASANTNRQQVLASNEAGSPVRRNTYRTGTRAQRAKGPSPKIINANELIHDRNDASIEVYAPLITDESGNIVTNPELLLDSNEQYITVTSPNGEQTRISAKFLGLLDKLYNRSQRAHDEAVWNSKFENWRKRLIVETEFMPASGNYMDILELKELLMEQ